MEFVVGSVIAICFVTTMLFAWDWVEVK